MGFFDQVPQNEGDEWDDESFDDDEFDSGGRWSWIGGVIPLQFVLARSNDAAVVVSHLAAYPEGFEFNLSAYVRRPPKGRRRRLGGPFDVFPGFDDIEEDLPDRLLRFGIEFADGGRATNLDEWHPLSPDATEPAHGLSTGSSGGSDSQYTWEYWAWPLPTDGDLTMVCEWPEYGITESRYSIASSEFAAALARAEPIWPDR